MTKEPHWIVRYGNVSKKFQSGGRALKLAMQKHGVMFKVVGVGQIKQVYPGGKGIHKTSIVVG